MKIHTGWSSTQDRPLRTVAACFPATRGGGGGGGGFSVNFRSYARLGEKFVTLCTDIFAWKIYPLYRNVQKIPPQNAPIFTKCTENFALNSTRTHLYAIYGTNFIQRYTSFLKIYRMLSGKMLSTMIKYTGNRTVKSCSFWWNIQNMEVFHKESCPHWMNPHLNSKMRKTILFLHGTIYLHHKSSWCGVNSKCLHVF